MNSQESTRSRLTFALHCICIIYETSASYDTCHYLKRTRLPQRNWTCVLYLRNILMSSMFFSKCTSWFYIHNTIKKLLHVIYIVSPSAFPGKCIDCGNVHNVSNIKNLNVFSMIMNYSFHGINYRIHTHCRQLVPKYLVMFHECKSA